MCIVFFEWTEDRFLVCHNRDEVFSRPTTNTEWWPIGDGDGESDGERFEILAPRDGVSGGTWFGFEKMTGRCAFLTNIREKNSMKYSTSRGAFVVDYLKSDRTLSALDYLQQEFGGFGSATPKECAGFNLVVFSGHDMAYFSNRCSDDHPHKGPIALSMGTPYGLSNSVLQEPYAKVRKGLVIFQQALAAKIYETSGNEKETKTIAKNGLLMEDLERLMQRDEYCPGDPLPRTGEPGFPEAIVRQRSSICVPSADGYGTRTTIRFLLERGQEGNEEANESPPRTRRLRCVEKNWNLATLDWETGTDLNCTI